MSSRLFVSIGSRHWTTASRACSAVHTGPCAYHLDMTPLITSRHTGGVTG